MKMINDFPRRNRLDLYTTAEKAIAAAVDAVERTGAHPLLTDAVILLGQAKEKVSDHAELSDLWQCPECKHVMTEDESKGYRGCPTGLHAVRHEPLVG